MHESNLILELPYIQYCLAKINSFRTYLILELTYLNSF